MNITNKKLTISILGYGHFGRLLADLLSQYYDRVFVYSRSKGQNGTKKIKFVSWGTALECDVIIPAVPIKNFESVIEKVATSIKPGATVVDVCSVKEHPVKAMKKHLPKGVFWLATHPMWGPDSVENNGGIKNLRMVLCPESRVPKTTFNELKKVLKKIGFEVIEMSAKEHDKQAARSQAITQFVGKTLQRMNAQEEPLSTLGHKSLLSIMPFVVNNTEELFTSLQVFNQYAQKEREKFIGSAHRVEEGLIRRQIEDDFDYCRRMIDWLDSNIMELLRRRFECSKKIGKVKEELGLPFTDLKREEEIIRKRTHQTGFNEKFMQNFYNVIFSESKRIMRENKRKREE